MRYRQMSMKEFYTIHHQVRTILHEHEECRNYDSLLICQWLQEYKGIETVEQIRELHKEISFESVRRARQLIQAKGDYPPTEEHIIRKRRLQDMYESELKEF